ncbi:MAG: VCBS repeat-containing protein [Deltaproteobacteria bacterium]|nr:VCBS repeat-containing protein [Deltaproteobacteria bacterium]
MSGCLTSPPNKPPTAAKLPVRSTSARNQGSGKFSSSKVTTLTSYGSYGYNVADLDQDGYQDVVIANYYNDSAYAINSMVYWGSAAGYSTADSTALATTGAVRVLIEDLNLDGWDDLTFVSHYNSTYTVNSIIYFGSASGFSTSRTTSLSTTGGWEGLVEDLDSDGYPDLIFCNYKSDSSYSTNSYIYWGSSGGYSSSDRTSLPTSGCHDVDTGDFNADGYPDIAFAEPLRRRLPRLTACSLAVARSGLFLSPSPRGSHHLRILGRR